MKNTALYRKMKNNGFGYRALAVEINRMYGSTLGKYDVFNFVHKKINKISRANRSHIRAYFILNGWIIRPKKRPAPVCRRCGLKYPTRKFSNKISSRNHKRSTKLSHK